MTSQATQHIRGGSRTGTQSRLLGRPSSPTAGGEAGPGAFSEEDSVSRSLGPCAEMPQPVRQAWDAEKMSTLPPFDPSLSGEGKTISEATPAAQETGMCPGGSAEKPQGHHNYGGWYLPIKTTRQAAHVRAWGRGPHSPTTWAALKPDRDLSARGLHGEPHDRKVVGMAGSGDSAS